MLVLLFLVNAAALPDDVPPEGLDLEAFYWSNASYFWALFAIYLSVITATEFVRHIASGAPPVQFFLSPDFAAAFVLLLVIAALVFVRGRLFHAVVAVALLVLFAADWSGRSIGIAPG